MTPLEAAQLPERLCQNKELRRLLQDALGLAVARLRFAGLTVAGQGAGLLKPGNHRLRLFWCGLDDSLTQTTTFLCASLEMTSDEDARGAYRMSLQLRSEAPPTSGDVMTGNCLVAFQLFSVAGLLDTADASMALEDLVSLGHEDPYVYDAEVQAQRMDTFVDRVHALLVPL